MVDLRSLLLMMAVADLALAVALWTGAGRRKDGLAQWSGALVVQALAFGLLGGSGLTYTMVPPEGGSACCSFLSGCNR